MFGMASVGGRRRRRQDRVLAGLVVAAVGLAAAAVPVYDIWTDVNAGATLGSTVLENTPLLVIAGLVVVAGGWLARSSWARSELRTIVGWTLGAAVSTLAVFSFVVGVQLYIQGELRPFVIAADAVLIAALAGVVIGVRSAERQQIERRRFQGLFEHVPNPIVETRIQDGTAIVDRVNPAFENTFGYAERDIEGEPLESYIVPPDSDVEPLETGDTDLSFPPEDIWNRDVIELETVHGRREFVPLLVPAEADERPSGYAIYIDVTPQKQRQERLEVLARILRHDIRNRVTIVNANADLLADRPEWEDIPREISEIQSAATDLLALGTRTRLAEQLALETGDQEPIDLVETVEAVVETVRETHDATITASLPTTATVRATPELATAIFEVIENAVEHHDRPSPTVELGVEATHDGEYYEVTIEDDGLGIPPDQYEVVTGDRERSQVEHVTGIGLWLTYWICRASGGDVEFTATDDGTVVTLRLPAADGAAAATSVSRPHPDRRPAAD